MRYTVTFTTEGLETYEIIKEQLNQRWGTKIVRDFEDRVVKFLKLVEVNPLIFPVAQTRLNLRKGFIHGIARHFMR